MEMKLEIPKLVSLEEAVLRRKKLAEEDKKVVLTNGCFDLLHSGHLYFLQKASQLGHALFIGLNGDVSVKELKGPTRPVQTEHERAYLMDSLSLVHTIFIFHSKRLDKEIRAIEPDIYTKAGDYDIDSIHPVEKTALLEKNCEIQFLPFLEGYSTTLLIDKINKAAKTF